MADEMIEFEEKNEAWLMPKFLEKHGEEFEKFRDQKIEDNYEKWAEEFRDENRDDFDDFINEQYQHCQADHSDQAYEEMKDRQMEESMPEPEELNKQDG
ncbi:MAG: hypothetical protein GY861_17205 [bacterium]|nr:hypothetical protein [bacterium]